MRLISVICAVLLVLPRLALAGPDLPQAPTDADFIETDPKWVALGRDLFFDPALSGNDNIACATCHHPALGTADAMSLSIGEGGHGLGADRVVGHENVPKARIPRHAPVLWNLGAREFVTMFHDGRVTADASAPFGVRMPEGRALERPVPSPLAAQNILPLLSAEEMAGNPGENPVADAVAREKIRGAGGAWDLITREIDALPGYRGQLDALIGPHPAHITDLARAISSFIAFEFRATDSPFDAFLRGDEGALTEVQTRGMSLFYGKAACNTCHAGPFQTDHGFHSIALPQFGPGKEGASGYADHGRAHVTGKPEDAHRFRTPTLRNVTLTAPYGHNGAYGTLEGIVQHHLDPVASLAGYDRAQADLPDLPSIRRDWQVMDDPVEVAAIAAFSYIASLAMSVA